MGVKFRKYGLYPVLLLVVAFILYRPVLNNDFSGLDDKLMIQNNWENLRKWSHVKTAFTSDVFTLGTEVFYRPLEVISYMPDAIFSDSEMPDPTVGFIINLGLFLLTLVGVYFFLGLFGFSPGFRFVFTLLYLIHPALVPAVAWLPGRVDIQLTALVMLAVYAYVKYFRSKKIVYLILHQLMFISVLLTKETGLVLPVLIVALDLLILQPVFTENEQIPFFKRLFEPDTSNQLWQAILGWLKQNKKVWITWLAILVIWFIARHYATANSLISWKGYLLKLGFAWRYLPVLVGGVLIPFNMGVFVMPTVKLMLLSLPGFGLLFLLAQKLKNSFSTVLFATVWIGLMSGITMLTDFVNYHRLMVVMLGMPFLLKSLDRKWVLNRQTIIFAAVLVLWGGWLLQSNIQFQKAFKTQKTFWQDGMIHAPETELANLGVGWVYHLEGNLDSALYYYSQTLKYNPGTNNVRISMAIIYAEKDEPAKADSLLFEELSIARDSAIVNYYIAQIWLERGDTAAALPYFEAGREYINRSFEAQLYYDSVAVKSPE